jgi:hypothetical protein
MKNKIIECLIIIVTISISSVAFGQIKVINIVDATSLTNCDGSATVSAIGNAGPFTFQWSNGQSDSTAFGLCPGLHMVTVSNAYGCHTPVTINIQVDCDPTFNFTITGNVKHSCDGRPNGAITNVTGVGSYDPKLYSYTYLWDNNSTGNNRKNLNSGLYCVTVTNHHFQTGAKCQQVKCFAIENSAPSIQVDNIESTCHGQNTGAIQITALSGLPYTYSWSNGSHNEDVSNLSKGTHTVTVTDYSGCTEVVQIKVPSYPEIKINHTSQNTCPQASSGFIHTTIVSGGIAPYTYSWSNGGTTSDINGLNTGYYSLTVTDDLGCTATIGTSIGVAAVTEIIDPNNCQYKNLWCNGSIIGSKFYGTYLATNPHDCRYLNEYCVLTDALVTFNAQLVGTFEVYDQFSCIISEVCSNGQVYYAYNGIPKSEYFSGIGNFGQPYCAFIEFCDFSSALGGYIINNIQYNQEIAGQPFFDQYGTYCPSSNPVVTIYYCGGSPLYYTCGPIAKAPPRDDTLNNVSKVIIPRLETNTGKGIIPELEALKGQFINASTGYFLLDINKLLSASDNNGTRQLYKYLNTDDIPYIYPNPFDNQINIDLTLEESKNFSITLVNLVGKKIFSQEHSLDSGAHTLKIDIKNDLPKGIYFLTINFENKQQKTFKLIH